MKKILYISSNDPEYYNGGAIGTRKFIKCFDKLEKNKKAEIYYFISKEKEVLECTNKRIEKKRNKLKTIVSRILGQSDQLSLYTKQILSVIEKNKIEIVVFQSSRLGNIGEKIKKRYPNIKILQNYDNFEYEFSNMYSRRMNRFLRQIELRNIKKIERKALLNSDYNIFLTKKDLENIQMFYKLDIKSDIVPLIYSKPKLKFPLKEKNVAIFTGTLDMESNIEAALFIINNIEKIKNETSIKKIILAGRNPSQEIKDKCSQNNEIILYENPSVETMTELLEKSSLYLSPVFIGSGMKTKFLEAISHGLPIVASNHTLVGYDFFEVENYDFIQKFNDFSLEEMIEKIKKIEEIKTNKDEILKFYEQNFEEELIINRLEKILMEKF